MKPKLFKIKQPVNVTFVDDSAPFVTLPDGLLLFEGDIVKWISADKKQTRLVRGLDRRGLDYVTDVWLKGGYIEELSIETAPPAEPVPPVRYEYTAVTQQRGEDFAAFTARLDKLGADGWRVHTLQSDTVFDPYNCEKIIILYALMEKVR